MKKSEKLAMLLTKNEAIREAIKSIKSEELK